MKKLYLFLSSVLIVTISFGQNLRPVAQKVSERKLTGAKFESAQFFSVNTSTLQRSTQLANAVSNATVMEFNPVAAKSLIAEKPENLNFIIPTNSGNTLDLELYKATLFTPDFSVVTSASNGQPVPYEAGAFYWGIIKGDNASLVAISIFENEVMGMISSPTMGNFVLGKIENDAQNRHILYNDHDLKASPSIQCYTENDGGSYNPKDLQSPPGTLMVDCIRLYWEVNFDIFQNKGANTTSYITGLFNQSAIIYTNDNIPVELSQIFIWTSASPYTSTSTSGLLGQFQSNRNSFNGDLGNLLGYAGGGGVAAGFSGLCASNLDNSQCYSGISSTFQNVPTYSWSVMVVTHEQGHLMGSRHTHACVWNGNNTAIDGCAGFVEGSCPLPGIPPNGGTIMSYCHQTGVGVNFSLGFGPQPQAVILNNYNNASCLSACTGTGCADNNEPNNTNTTSTLINVNTDYSALISPSGDIDFYRFNNTSSQRNIKVMLTNLPANYDLRLIRNGVVLVYSHNTGTTPETIIYNTSTTGSYKVKVVGNSGANSASQCYTLNVQISSTPFRIGQFDNAASGADLSMSDNENEISIYPNPANDKISVDFTSLETQKYHVYIYDLTGREMSNYAGESIEGFNITEISLEKLLNGIYFVRFEMNDQTFTQKLVKQ